MLRGPELLAKVKLLGSAPKSDVVRACGYVSSRKGGAERLNYTAFYEALLEAKGMSFGSAGESPSRRDSVGRKLSYIAKVHFNGNLLVGKAYTSSLGLKPGDEFDIRLERKGIRLIPKHRSEDMVPNLSASVTGAEREESEQPSAAAPVSPAPLPAPETFTPAAAPNVPVASPAAPPAYPVAPAASIPAPTAAPAAPSAPGPSYQPAPPVAAAPAPTTPSGTVPKQVDSWEDSLRKLDQSSRPERWDA